MKRIVSEMSFTRQGEEKFRFGLEESARWSRWIRICLILKPLRVI